MQILNNILIPQLQSVNIYTPFSIAASSAFSCCTITGLKHFLHEKCCSIFFHRRVYYKNTKGVAGNESSRYVPSARTGTAVAAAVPGHTVKGRDFSTTLFYHAGMCGRSTYGVSARRASCHYVETNRYVCSGRSAHCTCNQKTV
jgi:hypothetical protein